MLSCVLIEGHSSAKENDHRGSVAFLKYPSKGSPVQGNHSMVGRENLYPDFVKELDRLSP